ncbi:MAG: hypothetical protein D6701_03415 [Gemmatimonadetes bacterium]|nr:MAG: hypothetical protein D6701_03415 [Gemmatimonadota bacterium]
MATVDETFLRVQRILTGPMDLVVDVRDNLMSVAFQGHSTQIFIEVYDWGTDPEGQPRSLVHLTAPVLLEAPESAELYQWAATEGASLWFGHALVQAEQTPGNVRVLLKHTLLGDYLDAPELSAAMFGVLLTADEWDDQLQARFGGKRFVDSRG